MWGATDWTEDEPFSDRVPIYGAYGRTIQLGLEITDEQARLHVTSLALDAEPGGRW